MLTEFRNRIIKSNGVMNKPALADKEEQIVRELLAEHVRGFISGRYNVVYLPQVLHLRGFGGLALVVAETPERTLSNLRRLILDIATLNDPIPVHMESVEKCVERARVILGDESQALGFAQKYLMINKEILREILRILYQDTKINGTISAFESLAISEGLGKLYAECRKVKVGTSSVSKRIQALARFYDNILVISGAASHEPRTIGELRFGKGRRASYTLFSTPFTKALYYILNDPSKIDDYIAAYISFTAYVVKSYIENIDFELVVKNASLRLEEYKQINVDTEDNTQLRRTILILWKLLDKILKG